LIEYWAAGCFARHSLGSHASLGMAPKIKMPSRLTDLPNIGKAIAADLLSRSRIK
jgi:hypothetical protein